MKAAPHTELPEIHSFSITQYWPLIVILIPCLLVLFFLDTLHTHWCRLVCRNSVELNFVKTGLRSKFRVNPQFFSHELCPYVTRFFLSWRHSREKRSQALFHFTVLQATESWAGPGKEATITPQNLKPWNLILGASSSFSWKFPPTKITRYTVFGGIHQVL